MVDTCGFNANHELCHHSDGVTHNTEGTKPCAASLINANHEFRHHSDDVTHNTEGTKPCAASLRRFNANHGFCHHSDDVTHNTEGTKPCAASLRRLWQAPHHPFRILSYMPARQSFARSCRQSTVRVFPTGICDRGVPLSFTPLLRLKLLHACDQRHSSRGCSLLLSVDTVNSVQTRKAEPEHPTSQVRDCAPLG
jgi:hypothetical protein